MAPKTFKELEGYIASTQLPFVLKGILSVQDAKKAQAAGASGIVISNHGGAIIDYAIPPLKILPRIAETVGEGCSIILDGGIIRGTDVFKALALGAHGVLLGRTVMAGLAAKGSDGVREMLDGVNEELRRVMSLTGAKDLGNIDPSVLWPMQ